jgi:hypothetical protein
MWWSSKVRRLYSCYRAAPVLLARVPSDHTPCIGPATSAIHRAAEKVYSRTPVYSPANRFMREDRGKGSLRALNRRSAGVAGNSTCSTVG